MVGTKEYQAGDLACMVRFPLWLLIFYVFFFILLKNNLSFEDYARRSVLIATSGPLLATDSRCQ